VAPSISKRETRCSETSDGFEDHKLPRSGVKISALPRRSRETVKLFERPKEFEARKKLASTRLKLTRPSEQVRSKKGPVAPILNSSSSQLPGLKLASKRIHKDKPLARKLNPIDLYNSSPSDDLSSEMSDLNHGLPPKFLKLLHKPITPETAEVQVVKSTSEKRASSLIS